MAPDDDDDLAAEIGAALDAGKPQIEQEAPDETTEQAEERLYKREGRRFVAKEAEKAPEGEAQPVAAAETAPPKPWKPTWYKDEYGQWDKLAEPLRNALRDQERNAAQAIEKHSTSAKAWEPLNQALTPHMAELQGAGISPQQYYGELHQWNVALRTGDNVAKIDTLDRLAESVGLDLVQVGQWLAQNGKAPAPDPRDQRIAQLEQWKNNFETSQQQNDRQRLESEIQSWAKDKPDFAAVRRHMAAIAKQSPQASLDEMYEQARWAHPELRERILKEREDKRLSELKRARAAGATSPRTGPGNGATRTKPTMSLEEEIGAIYDGAV